MNRILYNSILIEYELMDISNILFVSLIIRSVVKIRYRSGMQFPYREGVSFRLAISTWKEIEWLKFSVLLSTICPFLHPVLRNRFLSSGLVVTERKEGIHLNFQYFSKRSIRALFLPSLRSSIFFAAYFEQLLSSGRSDPWKICVEFFLKVLKGVLGGGRIFNSSFQLEVVSI